VGVALVVALGYFFLLFSGSERNIGALAFFCWNFPVLLPPLLIPHFFFPFKDNWLCW
jgi:hypothetical protein